MFIENGKMEGYVGIRELLLVCLRISTSKLYEYKCFSNNKHAIYFFKIPSHAITNLDHITLYYFRFHITSIGPDEDFNWIFLKL